MKHYEIIRVREDGKVELPFEYTHELGLVKGAYFLVEIDTGSKEVHLERIALPGKRLLEVELVVEDRPGVLARVSGLFGRYGINILFSESEELKELDLAAIVAVLDVSNSRIPLEGLERELLKTDGVREVTLKNVE